MTFLGFLLGAALFGLGFLMVWRQRNFREYVGDLGSLFDMPGSSWLSWEVLGSILMFVGFLFAFGIFQVFASKLLQGIVFPTIG
jgi:hypothetical protein